MLLENLENVPRGEKHGWKHNWTNVEAIHMHFITQRNLLSQSYHSTLSNKYEVHTRQYDGRYVTKRGVVKLNKRVTDTHVQKGNDGNGRLRAPSWTRLCVGGAYKCLLSPSPLGMCAFLSGRDWKWQKKEAAFQMPGLLWAACCVTIWSDEKAKRLERWSSKQAGSERRSPCVHWEKDNVHSSLCPQFTPTALNLSLRGLNHPPGAPPAFSMPTGLRWASTRLGILAGGALRLRGRGGPWGSVWRETHTKKL